MEFSAKNNYNKIYVKILTYFQYVSDSGDVMALRKINWNDPLMRAIKAFNSIGGNSLTKEDLKRQRSAMDRAGRLAAPKGDVSIEAFKVQEISCEWIQPEMARNPQYVILYAHGGGYICGGLGYARILAAKLALATGFSVVSFAYRLAPEHKYPAQLEDGQAIWDYLLQKGYGASNILMAGDSAGGNLVLCLTQRLLKEDRIPPRALLLFSPWTDMSAESPSYEEYAEKDPILTHSYVCSVSQAYAGKDADMADPCFSPLNGDFEGFPPTFIMVGKNEILLDDSTRLHKKINKAGGKALIDIEKDGWHVYQQLPLPMANRAMKRLADYISSEIYEN